LSERKRKNLTEMNSMKKTGAFNNEEGSVLVIALVILGLLMILGVSATTTSNIENLVTRNLENYTVALYLAEAASMEGVQILEDTTPNPLENPPSYLNPTVNDVSEDDIITEDYWKGGAPVAVANGYNDPTTAEQDTFIIAGSEGVVGGSSLDMGKSNVYGYTIYGRCERKNSIVNVGVTYRRAF
jgi:hypothetical protein